MRQGGKTGQRRNNKKKKRHSLSNGELLAYISLIITLMSFVMSVNPSPLMASVLISLAVLITLAALVTSLRK